MATYYWVGGDGTWDASNTTNWATTSGGAGGAGAPNNTDTAIFDSASGAGTCTTASGAVCATATLNSSTLGLTLGDNLTMSGTFTFTSGALSLGTSTFTCNIFSSNNSNTRSIAFGSGNITITGSGTTIWSTSTATGFTLTGTPTVNCTYSGSTGMRSVAVGASGESNAINFNITSGADAFRLQGSSGAYKTIDFNGFGGNLTISNSILVFGNIYFSAGMTVNAGTSSIAFTATSGIQQITTNNVTLDIPITFNGVGGTFQLQDNCTVGSTRTVTLTNGALDLNNNTLSCGSFSSNNANTRSIAFGTGNITVTGSGATVWNMANVNNFSYTGTPTVYSTYSGATGTRTLAHGTAGGSGPKAVSLNITTGSDTVTVSNNSQIKDLNFTGFSGTVTNTSLFTFGNVTFSATSTLQSGTNELRFYSTSGTQQVTTNGLTLDFPITAFASGATVVFQDALTQGSTRAFTMRDGTTVKLKAGATSTVGAFATSGSNQKYLQSTTSGSQATLSQASGTVTVSYLSIKDIAATGGATWNAYVDYNNVDQGDNTGWDFSYSPAIDNEFPVALRSFTQPKRF